MRFKGTEWDNLSQLFLGHLSEYYPILLTYIIQTLFLCALNPKTYFKIIFIIKFN